MKLFCFLVFVFVFALQLFLLLSSLLFLSRTFSSNGTIGLVKTPGFCERDNSGC